jgi:hypothetical protein
MASRERRAARARALLATAGVLAAVATTAPRADTGALVGQLESEPMSLFDWGIHRIEEELQAVRRHGRDFVRVSYDPATARIIVEGTFFREADEVANMTPRDSCYLRLHALKLNFGVIDTNKLNVAPAADFRLGLKFSHHDPDAYPERPDAAAIGAELLRAIHIKVGVGSKPADFPFLQDMRCEGALMSQDVTYADDGERGYLPGASAPPGPRPLRSLERATSPLTHD